MLVDFEQNRLVQTTRNCEGFDQKKQIQKQKQKPRVCITIFDKELTPFWKTFL